LICPNCRQYTPDKGFKCINCGSILQKKDLYADQTQSAAAQRNRSSFLKPWMLLPLVLLAILAYLMISQRNKSHAVNSHAPGAELEIEEYLQKGKTNIVDFFSDYCPPCRKISPLLQKLGHQRPDLAIIKVDINREGVKGIDWSSPLARQYELSSVPHFQIYDADGNLLLEGQEAFQQVFTWLAAAGIKM
jgi:thiol-disulfide isomerase/thioredoxin